MTKAIWFDMDGTIANLYGVENWLNFLDNEDATPYEIAKPLINMQVLARLLNKAQNQGYTINIISWLSKNSTDDYDEMVTKAKIKWLKKHLKSVKFDKIDIVPYGTPKQDNRFGFLFDDEKNNRNNWNDVAFDEKEIIKNIKKILKNY